MIFQELDALALVVASLEVVAHACFAACSFKDEAIVTQSSPLLSILFQYFVAKIYAPQSYQHVFQRSHLMLTTMHDHCSMI